MALESIRLFGTTDASGDLVLTSKRAVLGLLWEVAWVDGDLADGVGAVLSAINDPDVPSRTLLTLTAANDDAWYRPRAVEDDETGSAATNRVPMTIDGRLRLTISTGGNAKTGGMVVYYID